MSFFLLSFPTLSYAFYISHSMFQISSRPHFFTLYAWLCLLSSLLFLYTHFTMISTPAFNYLTVLFKILFPLCSFIMIIFSLYCKRNFYDFHQRLRIIFLIIVQYAWHKFFFVLTVLVLFCSIFLQASTSLLINK